MTDTEQVIMNRIIKDSNDWWEKKQDKKATKLEKRMIENQEIAAKLLEKERGPAAGLASALTVFAKYTEIFEHPEIATPLEAAINKEQEKLLARSRIKPAVNQIWKGVNSSCEMLIEKLYMKHNTAWVDFVNMTGKYDGVRAKTPLENLYRAWRLKCIYQPMAIQDGASGEVTEIPYKPAEKMPEGIDLLMVSDPPMSKIDVGGSLVMREGIGDEPRDSSLSASCDRAMSRIAEEQELDKPSEKTYAESEPNDKSIDILGKKFNPLTLVKIGGANYKPTSTDLEEWRQIFEDAQWDKDICGPFNGKLIDYVDSGATCTNCKKDYPYAENAVGFVCWSCQSGY